MLNKLYLYYKKIEIISKQEMIDVVYHNLPKIKGMYIDTLGIDIGDIGTAFKAVAIRHHIVHRNGRDKNGDEVIVDKLIVEKLIVDISIFIETLDEKIQALNEGPPW